MPLQDVLRATIRSSRLPRLPVGVALPLPALNLFVAVWLLALLNVPFWRALWQAVGGWDASHAGYLFSLPLLVLLWVWLLLECLTWRRAAKPTLGVVLFLSAAAAYFMHVYGVVFDRSMIANIVETHSSEALEFLTPGALGWLLVFAIAPIWLLLHVEIQRQSWPRDMLVKATTLGALIGGIAVVVALFSQSYAPLLRNHRELRLQLVPANYLAATHGYLSKRMAMGIKREFVTLDARRNTDTGDSTRPTLTILVIGETARAANFGLNGYGRPTTPELAKEPDVVNFRQVRSCGTSTAVSLPCMFLDVGRAGFSDTLAAHRDNLLDVLQRAGFYVLWRDNNSGCKGICDRVQREDLASVDVPELCERGECYDEILLRGLQAKLDALDRDAVVVLHMRGSHGPAYHLRYPSAFEYFKPACKMTRLDHCERAAIVNAYDNTLRYSDHVLARTIELLRRNSSRFDTSLVYVSDHGESLGERGLYLHGIPYAIAPSEQTAVPMLVWLSPGAQERFGVHASCLREKQDDAFSHDNLYHSVLGLLGVETSAYRPGHDLFRDCRFGPDSVMEASVTDRHRIPSGR